MMTSDVVPPPTVLRAWIEPKTVGSLLAAYGAAEGSEPCGLLLGREEGLSVRVVEIATLPNRHAAPYRAFLLDPEDQLRVGREARERGLEVIGEWHGHLRGPAWPGYADEDASALPAPGDLPSRRRIVLIVGRGDTGRPVVRAFAPRQRGLREIPLRV